MNTITFKGAWLKHALFLLTILCVWNGFDSEKAWANEFDVEQYNAYVDYQGKETPDEGMDLISDIGQGTNQLITIVVDAGFDILAIVFILAVIAVGGALTLRNGQWMKWSVGAMIGTFSAILAIRLGPILVLTIDLIGFTMLLNDIILFLVNIAVYISFFMILVGLFLRSLDKIFEHPKYFKWGRGLLAGSAITLILGSVVPIIIGNI